MKIIINQWKSKKTLNRFFFMLCIFSLISLMSFSVEQNHKVLPLAHDNPYMVQDSFSFSHKYVMQIQDGKRTTDLEYFLSKSDNYFATQTTSNKNITTTVMDVSNSKMHMFMDTNGDKTRMSMKLNFKNTVKHAIDETKVTITPTGTTKTILGYVCNGYNVKGDDVEGTVWVTQQAGVSFAKAFYKTDLSQSTDPNWQKIAKGLTLEMDMVDTSKRKPKSINMKCISLDKASFTINSNNYKKLM